MVWGDIDYLFVDMPPGTGDVPLTVFQSLPVEGIIIVTSPQELVQMIVKKAYNMAGMMNVPVLGIVENYSYLKCPDCGKEISLICPFLENFHWIRHMQKLPMQDNFILWTTHILPKQLRRWNKFR